VVARLAALGVGTVQLRAKNLNDSEALQLISDALAVTRGTATNSWSMITGGAASSQAQAPASRQEDLVDADLATIRDAGLTLGLSTHDDAELETAAARKA